MVGQGWRREDQRVSKRFDYAYRAQLKESAEANQTTDYGIVSDDKPKAKCNVSLRRLY